jgi:hypothetical protein
VGKPGPNAQLKALSYPILIAVVRRAERRHG